MGQNGSKPDPSYIYKSTCRNQQGIPCSKAYITYQSDGHQLQQSLFITPCRHFSEDDRESLPEYVAAMVVKHPKKPANIHDFVAECLDEHNLARGRHGVQPLLYNKKMSIYATQWAEELARSNRLRSRPDCKYGENLFVSCGRDIKGSDPVTSWYNEIVEYDFKDPGFNLCASSFSQIIWRGSTKLGIGFAKSGRSTFVVCNYDPPGNFADEFANNVPPPI